MASDQINLKQTSAEKIPLRVGFIALSDCAPIVMAQELGLFEKHGLHVQLSREPGWATIRDKIIYRELEAAHATAPMVFAATLGLGSVQAHCVTGIILSLNGVGITLSEKLWRKGIRDGEALRDHAKKHPLVFGAVFPFSSHHFLLRQWLINHGIEPGRDAQIAIVPPAQMFQNLKAGHLDGYCVGEPWNSMAVSAGLGWCAALGAELAPRHPEKILMVRRDFAENREEAHLGLIGALLESCSFCDQPENAKRIAEILARREFVNAPAETIQLGLEGRFHFGHGRTEEQPDFHIFSEGDANDPLPEKADWVISQMKLCGLIDRTKTDVLPLVGEIFRRDIYQQALVPLSR